VRDREGHLGTYEHLGEMLDALTEPDTANSASTGQPEFRGGCSRHPLSGSKLPEHARQTVAVITRTAFTTGLNRILLVAAIIALVSGVVSLTAIRSKDFVQQRGAGSAGRTAAGQKATQPEQAQAFPAGALPAQ